MGGGLTFSLNIEYLPLFLVEAVGLEPTTAGKSAPYLVYKTSTLPIELHPQVYYLRVFSHGCANPR